MYIKLKNRLRIHIIKYILSQKLEKYIKLIKYKINITEEIKKEFDDIIGRKKNLIILSGDY